MQLGEFLRGLRGKRTLKEVEAAGGPNASTIHRMEKGADPTVASLEKLASAYGLKASTVLKRAGK
jgi:transcriptional regulator with XRE-family HTH domain